MVFELILLNANSPQNEEPLIRPYLEKHDNIRYEHLQEDPGIYGTWNIALEMSTGSTLQMPI